MLCKLPRKSFFTNSFLDGFAKSEEPSPALCDSWKSGPTGNVDDILHDYQFAFEIYKKCDYTDLGDYRDVYLKTDVLLLAETIEKFRSVCLSVFKLNPAHFYSAWKLSCESLLISTRVKLGPLEYVLLLLFFERGTVGDINGVGDWRPFFEQPFLDKLGPNQKSTFSAFYDLASLYVGKIEEIMPRCKNG